jgi:hypothetical protein
MFLAFVVSGFFMQRRWWVRALLVVFLLPWALPALSVWCPNGVSLTACGRP